MKKLKLIAILIFIKSIAVAQPKPETLHIKQTLPDQIYLKNIPDSNNYSYITLIGTGLEKII
ncbi:MAG TPA: hypothetical protein PKN75_06370 [Bacteroidia bacterium]|nr:hypothetical protein [Bacteroidia bacterium]HNU33199.1 hypothetical protein [Bacteroidia bacterium]